MHSTAQPLRSLLSILIITAGQGIQFLWLAVSSRAQLSAEVLFLRKQLAFYKEHQVRPRKLTDAARFSLVLWSRLFNWRAALMIVKPETLVGWHRQGFKLFWRWKSRFGRPRIPENLRRLMVRLVQENPTWGEELTLPVLLIRFSDVAIHLIAAIRKVRRLTHWKKRGRDSSALRKAQALSLLSMYQFQTGRIFSGLISIE
jgi:hypothetical protein